ncbi:MAG: DUF4349 domain-containing protein [Mobilitalea sp.]
MKRRKRFQILTVILVIVITATACGSKNASTSDTASTQFTSSYDMDDSQTEESKTESPEMAVSEDGASGSEYGFTDATATSTGETLAVTQDKIIYRCFLDIETQEFDTLINKLNSEIVRLGGYIESSQISGKRYYSNEERNGSIIARIPKDKVDEFVNTVNTDSNANVINKEESTDNVTLAYIDTESRKKSLEIEQERLFALLEKTDTLENIIELESRLSDIRYELQNYESQLRSYDNQVEYSTITMSVQEVERITPDVEEKKTVGSRIKNGFSDTMYNISEGLKNFFVWFVVNIPYLMIWAAFIIIILLIVRKYYKKKNEKDTIGSGQKPMTKHQPPQPPMDNNDKQ